MKLKQIFIIITIISISFSVQAGNYFDDWTKNSQIIKSSANNFNTGGRTFGNFGALSYHWQTDTIRPISITRPRIKAGCGGIDINLGGYNFVDFDYFVEKANKIIQNAPAFAFNIALATLSNQAYQSMGDVFAVIDRLNSLQLDECKASKAMVTVGKDLFAGKGQESFQSAAVNEFAQESGLSGLYHATAKLTEGETIETASAKTGAKLDDMYKGCSQDVKDVFFKNGSMFENLADLYSLDKEMVSLIRGIVGDISVNNGTFTPKQKCTENSNKTIRDIVEGKTLEMDKDFQCTKVEVRVGGINYNSLKEYVSKNLEAVLYAQREKKDLTDSEKGFYLSLEKSIKKSLEFDNQYIKNQAISLIVSNYDAYIATSITTNLLNDLTDSMMKTLIKAEHLLKGTSSNANCKKEIAAGSNFVIDDKKKLILSLLKDADYEYSKIQQIVLERLKIAQQIEERKIMTKKSDSKYY
ncbi:MAG: hypothetical protein GY714_09630 [Desulfobacterales bacterium]|nr:hypothetical protein [Desulfobacterales bacterium]